MAKQKKQGSWLTPLIIIALLAAAGVALWHKTGNQPAPDSPDQAAQPAPAQPARAEAAAPVELAAQAPAAPQTPAQPTQPEPQPAAQPIAAAPEPVGRAADLLQQGRRAYQQAQFYQASNLLSQAFQAGLPADSEKEVLDLLNAAADQWLFSRQVFEGDPHSTHHKVQSGEYLVNIGRRYNVPYELIMKINGIANASSLRLGQTLKVIQGPFNVHVDRSSFRMIVTLGDVIVRSYPVGLGAPGRDTPTGLWKVSLKQPNPEWVDPETGRKYLPNDPENPLGDHWVAMEGLEGDSVGRTGFGIHGTSRPDEIGKRASRGCIRLHNGNAAEVYDLLVVGKSHVTVTD